MAGIGGGVAFLMRTFIFIALAVLATGCSRKSNTETPAPDSDTFKQEAITEIYFLYIHKDYPSVVYFSNKGELKGYFKKDDAGQYRVEFHGLNGRAIVEGNPRHMNVSTNLTQWPIRVGDTIRVFKKGVKYRDYVTGIEDNLNDGIIYAVSVFDINITQQVADKAKADMIAYTAKNGIMSNMKFVLE